MDKEEVKKVIHSVTSNIVKTEEELRGNSTGKANTKTSPSVFISNEKILPRYLKVSTNSCHDYCKYGKKHIFESKKRTPNLHMSSASSAIQNEEQTEVSTLRGRRKKQETKVNSTQSKVKSFEAPETEKFSTPLLPCEGEESSKEPIILNTMTPSPFHQIEELSVTSETLSHQSSSPTEKRVISHDAITPLIWSEKSTEGSESMELDSPSSTHTPKDQLEGSSEELGFETVTSLPVIESVGLEKTTASLPTDKSVKAKIIPPSKKSTASSSRVEKSSEKSLSMKLKTPKPKENQIENLKMVEGMKRGVDKTKMSPQSKTEQPTVVKKTITSAREKITAASVKLKVAEHKSPFSAKKVIMSKSPIFTKQKESLVIKKIDEPAQPSISLKSTTPVLKSTPTLLSSRSTSAQRNSTNKIVKSLDPALKSSKASTSIKPSEIRDRYRSLKPSFPAKSPAKVGKPEDTNEKAKEKNLYVIEPKPVKASPKPKAKELKKNRAHSSSSTSSSPSSSSSSSLSVSLHDKEESKKFECTPRKATELALAKDKTKRSKPTSSPKYNEKRRLTRIATATVPSEAKASSTYMMKFRRGKVINPMPENNTPRILKFRQPKGTNEKNKDVGRTIRRRRVSSGSSAELIAPSLETPAVVLRHQDVQEKESQTLFNEVIEETASKLVETRKSKVKALVGAFETVISLQESRVAPTV